MLTIAAIPAPGGVASAAGSHPPATGHAYPWGHDVDVAPQQSPAWSSYHVDAWGFPVRWCSSYVAWYEASRGHPLNSPGWKADTATIWAHSTIDGARGSLTPHVGDIMLWMPGQDFDVEVYGNSKIVMSTVEGSGHQAVVLKVYKDHTIKVGEYNNTVAYGYDTERVYTTHRFITWTSGHKIS